VKYSLLDRGPERDKTVDRCRELGVSLIAHSPLEQGLLTGRGLEVPSSFGGKAEQVTEIKNRELQTLREQAALQCLEAKR